MSNTSRSNQPLAGHIAVVTGASRGIGRGVALVLGEQGAVVYLTGRTLEPPGDRSGDRSGNGSGDAPSGWPGGWDDDGEDRANLPGSLRQTADDIAARGGVAVPVQCDHDDDAQVQALFQRVEAEHGRLDILVNNVFAVAAGPLMNTPFWDQPIAMWDTMHRIGLRSHYVAGVFAARLMIRHERGLIANISSFGGAGYQVNVAYGVGKAGVDRLARDMAHDLRPHNVAAVSLWPGVVRTERITAMGERSPFPTAVTESPEFTGRAIAALARDPALMERTGETLVVAELAAAYGFTDIDGSSPRSLRRPRRRAPEPAAKPAATEPHPLLARAREHTAGLRARSADIEAARRVPADLAAGLAAAGFFNMLVPASAGGGQVHPRVVLEVIEQIAQGDAASAWCLMVGATTGPLLAYLDVDTARLITAAQPTILAGVFAPMGHISPDPDAPGDYRISGRWTFASGCDNATWFLGNCLAADPDGGRPALVSVWMPMRELTIHDTWSVSGLCGTGSHDVEASAVRVPAGRTTRIYIDEPRDPAPLYRFPLNGIFALGIAAVGLGIARAALDDFNGLAATKKSGNHPLNTQGHVQIGYARVEARLRAARAYLEAAVDRAWTHVAAARARPEPATVDQYKVELRLAACNAVKASVLAVDFAYHHAGGSAIYQRHPFQRYFRDIHTVTQHLMVSPAADKLAGRVVLGVPTDNSQL